MGRHKPAPVQLPRFFGDNPERWLAQAAWYFSFYKIPQSDQLSVASFYLDDVASDWFDWMHRQFKLTDWNSFSLALAKRFRSHDLEEPEGQLAKLLQTSSVADYRNRFEEISNRSMSLPPLFLIRCFISGLRQDLKQSVLIHKPKTLDEAMDLAQLHETRVQFEKGMGRVSFGSTKPLLPTPATPPLSSPTPLVNAKPGNPNSIPATVGFKRLTPSEIAHKRSLDTFDSSPSKDATFAETLQLEEVKTQSAISYNALSGGFSSSTLRFQGMVKGKSVQVLLDGGSTHCFVQTHVAHYLEFTIESIPPFSVLVGSGEKLPCSGIAWQVELIIQDHSFKVDLYVLPLQGWDMVLGVSWLATLGPVLTNYGTSTFEFDSKGTRVVWQGDPSPVVHETQFNGLRRLAKTDSISELFHLTVSPLPSQTPTSYPPDLVSLLDEFSTQGIIQPSTSPFSSPVLLVRKKDGTWRFCVDYRALNTITVRDRFPIPSIDELFDELHGAKFFSKLELLAGYHQIRIQPSDVPKTAFRMHDGHYEFLVMPFGLTNAPSTFQRLMNDVFRPFLRKFVLFFFDDVLIYSTSWTAHMAHIRSILQLLLAHKLVAKISKCIFGQTTIGYLGHVISPSGLAVDPAKIQVIAQWHVPTNAKEVRSFLGIVGYYRRFINNYASIAAPLTDLLKNSQVFTWDSHTSEAFLTLKQHLCSTHVLSLPDFSQPFTIETDASGIGIGAVLSQNRHPLAYLSQKLFPRMQQASTYQREMFAITQSVAKWRQYLLGRKFIIITDQQPLRTLQDQVIQTPDQHKWLGKLLGFDFEIQYRPGRHNSVADALSRLPHATLTTLSYQEPTLLQDLRQANKKNPTLRTIQAKCTSSSQENSMAPLHADTQVLLAHSIACPPIFIGHPCVAMLKNLWQLVIYANK
ncbi:hypothetical protein E3N88_14870 [Mikania micrantha]|uniref:Reverse transcriptase domain-containing protein n=1 Tax=Mikania micrantha TaxID=192012 RepID=A0A5N6P2P1_9ASTR|nr:hypothetical protein E3N88_14870 [Mikania micrantha]